MPGTCPTVPAMITGQLWPIIYAQYSEFGRPISEFRNGTKWRTSNTGIDNYTESGLNNLKCFAYHRYKCSVSSRRILAASEPRRQFLIFADMSPSLRRHPLFFIMMVLCLIFKMFKFLQTIFSLLNAHAVYANA